MEKDVMKVLAGDVGGTSTRLAVCEVNEGKVLREVEDVQPSDPEKSFKDIVQAFLAEQSVDVRAVCFGLPGPVRGRRARLTNLPWAIDADELERELGLPTVSLINDLEANAHGLSTLSSADIKVLREGVGLHLGNAGLVSAGTGLGEAGMHWVDGAMHPFATEGGHASFGPRNQLQFDLLLFLQKEVGDHVSWERVVSGPGLCNIYAFLKWRDPEAEPAWLAEEMEAGDKAALIAKHALAEKSELCRDALDLFLELYGAEAGNFALKILALGGIYLGGGIVPKVSKALPSSKFVEAFDAKGRMRELISQIPIRVVLNDKAALQGAALYASRRAKPR
jgi:glucokinase